MDENGKRYFGSNYDFSTTTSMIVRTKPGDGRYASVSSVDLQFLGIKDGIYVDSLVQKLTCLAAIKELNKKMNIPNKILGIKKKDILLLSKHAEKEANPLYPVPELYTSKELSQIYYRIGENL